MANRLIVFDVDGTLVDSIATITRCMTEAFQRFGVTPPTLEAIRSIVGLSLPEAVGRISGEISPELLVKIVSEYKERFMIDRATRAVPDPLFDGAMDCLDELADAGYALAVATGKSRKGLSAVMAHYDLAHRFVAVGTADDGPGKPHPFMLEKVMAEAGADAADTAMIGDTSFDIEMACAAGATGVGVAWGNHSAATLTAAGAASVAPSFPALTAWLRTRFPL